MADPKKAPGDPNPTQREAEAQAATEGVNKPESESPGDPRSNMTDTPAAPQPGGPGSTPRPAPGQPQNLAAPQPGGRTVVPRGAINPGSRGFGAPPQRIPNPAEGSQFAGGPRLGNEPALPGNFDPANLPAGFHHTPALAQAGLIDLLSVVHDVRDLTAAIRARDWPTVLTIVGRLSMYAASLFGSQDGVFAAIGAAGGGDVAGGKVEFDRAADEFGQARAECYSYAPKFVGAGENEGPVVQFDPSSILVALELAAKIIKMFQEWRRNRQPVAP